MSETGWGWDGRQDGRCRRYAGHRGDWGRRAVIRQCSHRRGDLGLGFRRRVEPGRLRWQIGSASCSFGIGIQRVGQRRLIEIGRCCRRRFNSRRICQCWRFRCLRLGRKQIHENAGEIDRQPSHFGRGADRLMHKRGRNRTVGDHRLQFAHQRVVAYPPGNEAADCVVRSAVFFGLNAAGLSAQRELQLSILSMSASDTPPGRLMS